MAYLYFYLLFAICFALLVWGLWKPERVYQYPFFMGATFTSFILPQAISLLKNPGPVTQQALARVLLMSCLCVAMCWLGYQLTPSPNFIKKLDISVDHNRLLHCGIIFVLIGYIFTFLIYRSLDTNLYTRYWTGIATIYNFFANLIYPGLTIILISTFQRPNFIKILLCIGAVLIPLQTIIIYGRREPIAILLLSIGLSLYFTRKFIPPRWLIITLIFTAIIITPLAYNYRMISQNNDWNQLQELRPVEKFEDFIEQGQTLELRNAALLMDAAAKTGQYKYGMDYWNSIIFNFVPAQIVGKNVKKSLQILSYRYNLKYMYNYSIPAGSTNTGIADSFIQFDYFGCLFFVLLGYFFKNLWILAKYTKSMISQVFYIGLISPSILSITHQTVTFLPALLFLLFFMLPVIMYSRNKLLIKSNEKIIF
jgi:hypothetical protein